MLGDFGKNYTRKKKHNGFSLVKREEITLHRYISFPSFKLKRFTVVYLLTNKKSYANIHTSCGDIMICTVYRELLQRGRGRKGGSCKKERDRVRERVTVGKRSSTTLDAYVDAACV